MSGIRVTYSGLIGFAISLSGLITGTAFTLIVTRQLSPEEFGVWAIIGSMVGYFLVAEPIISYWSTRQIARNEPVGMTSIVSSTVFALGTVPFYLILATYFYDVDPEYRFSMILAAILLPISFVSQTLAGINLGHKPHATRYSMLAFESLKIPAGLAFVYFMGLGLEGVIVATLIAFVGKLILQIIFARHKIRVKFNIQILYNWIRLSWIPLYSNIAHVIWTLDVVIFLLITDSLIGVGFYSAAAVISNIVGHSKAISEALYPKLLAKGNFDYIKENINRQFFFLIPLLGATVIFSKPALFALNPAYQELFLATILLAFRVFFYVLTSIFSQIIMGIEKIDVRPNIGFYSMLKSKLFYIPTLTNIHYALYIVSLVIMLLLLNSDVSDHQLVEMWSVILLILSIPFAIYLGIMVKRQTKTTIPYKNIGKYCLATFVFMAVFYLVSDSILTYDVSIYSHLPQLLILLAMSVGIYIGLMLLIDKNTRDLSRRIMREFKSE